MIVIISFCIIDSSEIMDGLNSSKRSPMVNKSLVLTVIVVILIPVILAGALTAFVTLPEKDVRNETEIFNINNDTVLLAIFNRQRYNRVRVIHRFVYTYTFFVYSIQCKSLYKATYQNNETVAPNHSVSLNSLNHAIIVLPTYLLPRSKLHFKVTVLNVSVITANIYLYLFNDLDLFYDYFENNLSKNILKRKISIYGTGPQHTTTTVDYKVTSTGYVFAAIISDSWVELEYNTTLNQVLYDRSKLTKMCTLTNDESCEIAYHLTTRVSDECILGFVSTPTVNFNSPPARMTTVVSRKGLPVSFYVVLALLLTFIISLCVFMVYCCVKKHC